MNNQIQTLVQEAEAYLQMHLYYPDWEQLTSAQKLAFVAGAKLDVLAMLDHAEYINCDDESISWAIFEQAAHAAHMYRLKKERKSEISRESVNGIGSRSFRLPEEEKITEFSERAKRLIRQFNQEHRNTLHINRG